jgi:hypothetical protein
MSLKTRRTGLYGSPIFRSPHGDPRVSHDPLSQRVRARWAGARSGRFPSVPGPREEAISPRLPITKRTLENVARANSADSTFAFRLRPVRAATVSDAVAGCPAAKRWCVCWTIGVRRPRGFSPAVGIRDGTGVDSRSLSRILPLASVYWRVVAEFLTRRSRGFAGLFASRNRGRAAQGSIVFLTTGWRSH